MADELTERHRLDSLYTDTSQELMDELHGPLVRVQTICKAIVERIDKTPKLDLWGAERATLALDKHIDDLPLVAGIHLMGLPEIEEAVHLHSFCSWVGKGALATHILRDGKPTSSTSWDTDGIMQDAFGVIKTVAPEYLADAIFEQEDIGKPPRFEAYGRPMFWMAHSLLGPIVQRAVRTPLVDLPQKMVLLPCNCCAYSYRSYPLRDDDEDVTKATWNTLHSATNSFSRNTRMIQLNHKFKRVMDALRAFIINKRSEGRLKARVQNVDYEHNIILVNKMG